MLLRSSLATVVTLQLLIATDGFLHVQGKVGFGSGEQEWGYVTVRPRTHMFWWLHYTTAIHVNDVHDKPLIIRLQGPGSFTDAPGYFKLLEPHAFELNSREHSWVNEYNVLFINTPIGSGFSYTTDYSSGYAKNNTQIAEDLLKCMKGFLMKFPKFANVPTYTIAQYIGGKIAAEFALLWAKAQKVGNIESNLQGVALGNPWISPVDAVLSWAPFLLHTGFADSKGFEQIDNAAKEIKLAIDSRSWKYAFYATMRALNVIKGVIGDIDMNNIARDANIGSKDSTGDTVIEDEVRKALELNVTWRMQQHKIFSSLEDFMKPVTNIVEQLLNETDIEVFVFSGHWDLLVLASGTLAWVEKLKWKNSAEWYEAPKRALDVNDVTEGYVKQYSKLKMYWINRAGRMALKDNPTVIFLMLADLTNSIPDD